MFRVFCSRTGNLKRFLNAELLFWFCGNFLRHRPKMVHSPACAVNHFNTLQQCWKDHFENFNPSVDVRIKKQKKPTGVKVYVLNDKGIKSSMYLHEAEKLAQHQKLQLQKTDEINGVAAYKLVSISELIETEYQSEVNRKKKDEKNEKIKKIVISGGIKSHDLQNKINHINRFLEKGIKVFIKLGDKDSESSKLSALYEELEKSCSQYSITKVGSKSGYHINIAPKKACNTSEKSNE